MSATLLPYITPRTARRSPDGPQPRARSRSARGAAHRTVPAAERHGRGGRGLFAIPFASAMSAPDLARLARLLDLTTHMHPKLHPDPTSPGVARLDHFSGLYLERGAQSGQWVLEARTWGSPAPETVHGWQLLAAFAARQLDPTVPPAGRTDPSREGMGG